MYTLNDFLKETDIQKALSENNLDYVYHMYSRKWGKAAPPTPLTEFLLNNNINPLDYMSKIFPYMYYKLKIRTIEIPEWIDTIDDFAFLGCNQLEKVICRHPINSLGKGIFSGCYNLTVYCNEDSSLADYCLTYDISFSTRIN